MAEQPHISIRDLAARLGLGRSAVSMALRNHPHISEKTRRRVQAEAERLGYRPNALVTALMAQIRTRRVKRSGETIAFFSAYKTKDDWLKANPHDRTLQGARDRAEHLGFRVEPFWLGLRGGDSARIARILRARAVRGAIIGPMPLDLEPLQFDWNSFFTVSLGYSFSQRIFDRVANNQFNIIRLCYDNLWRLGHRRIGLAITKESDDRVQHLWLGGFTTSQQVLGGAPIPPLWMEYWEDHPDSKKQFLKWYRAHKPDAVLGIGPDNPLLWMRESGVRVPERTGYANIDLNHKKIGVVAGALQNLSAVGSVAVDLVTSGISRNEHGIPETPKVLLIDATWSEGPTVSRRK
ncbi:LacI family DNA-binding transcriptional regulator [Geminisphaera colitermitum]|uniref:LacI family DNA-binding transcriptional regulator n=1 Tax=Geminisphaera colitermitum TaxID=1148786 RepID=UPI0001964F02|nr:LacI family DNA-binding transcriptional regulator [Geminisphaera colitermitum]